ncbi:MAG: hypothetical protein NTZ97_03840 [Candidatus Moranbacteria bacterium]|nr:hypothetical protein [Candidatus Moranbacteria bacterium]
MQVPNLPERTMESLKPWEPVTKFNLPSKLERSEYKCFILELLKEFFKKETYFCPGDLAISTGWIGPIHINTEDVDIQELYSFHLPPVENGIVFHSYHWIDKTYKKGFPPVFFGPEYVKKNYLLADALEHYLNEKGIIFQRYGMDHAYVWHLQSESR